MKNLITLIALIVATLTAAGQTKLSSETTVCFDKNQNGIPLNRIEVANPKFSVKYDYKVDLIKNNKVDDVFGVFIPKIIEKKNFTFGGGLIKLGDGNRSDDVIIDLFAQKKFRAITIDLEIGRAFNVESIPWDYIISRASTKLFTAEGGILSHDPMTNDSQKDLYGWVAFHPEHYFLATGNEISRNWLVFGTKKFKNVGNLTVGNFDRDNGNFWFRSQFGFKDVNQKFYSQEMYVIATSYLVVPPFFYMHFSPISTKGKYGLKFDGRRTGKLEVYEVSTSRQFGKYGQIAIGATNKNFNEKSTGWLLEYYKEFSLKDFRAVTELRYEQLTNKFTGFITLCYTIK